MQPSPSAQRLEQLASGEQNARNIADTFVEVGMELIHCQACMRLRGRVGVSEHMQQRRHAVRMSAARRVQLPVMSSRCALSY